jgi:WD40 repeat protein/Flp pilus assembly protein TadD
VESEKELAALEGHREGGMAIAFDATGERLLSNDWSALLRVWDWRSGKQILTLPSGSHVHARFVSADGRLFAFSQNGQKMWVVQFDPGTERKSFAPLGSRSGTLSFDPDGRLAAVTKIRDWQFGDVAVLDPEIGAELGRLPGGGGDRLFHTAKDGALFTNGDRGVVRWPRVDERANGSIHYGPPQLLGTGTATDVLSASPDGRIVVRPFPMRPDGAVAIRTDQVGMSIPLGPQQDVRFSAVSPDGQYAATSVHGHTIEIGMKVWDVPAGRQLAHFKPPFSGPVAFSSDGRWLACFGGSMRVLRTETWLPGPDIPEADKANSHLFSPDSRILAVGGHAVVRLVRVEDGVELVRLPFAEQVAFHPLAFTPDGTRLYVLNRDTGEAVVWDLYLLRSRLAELKLDWDAPPLPRPAATKPPPRVEFIGADLLADPQKMAAHDKESVVVAVAANPFDALACTRLGYDSLERGALTNAVKLFSYALALDPTREDARIHRARAYHRLGQVERAAADAIAVHERLPKHPLVRGVWGPALNDLAVSLATGPPGVRDPKRALELITKVNAEQPNNHYFLHTLGMSQYHTERYEEAVASLKKSIELGRGMSDGFSLYYLAMSHAKLGQSTQAQDCFARAAKWVEKSPRQLMQHEIAELKRFREEAADVLNLK